MTATADKKGIEPHLVEAIVAEAIRLEQDQAAL